MGKHMFEINVHGEVSRALLAELGATRLAPTPPETVITTNQLAPDQLQRIVGRIADLGLDVVALRRLPCPIAPLTA